MAVAAAPTGPPPPPASTNGNAAQQVAFGLSVPTSFAFGAGQVFASDNGSENGKTKGGVFLLQNGTATRLPGSPPSVFGLAWRKSTLYVSAGLKLYAWSGWTGTKFSSQKVIYTAPKGFQGFNGLAFGANGRLYAGVDTGSSDHGPSNTPYARDVLSFNANGKDLRVVASGIRQPWQLAFPAGSSSPFVSDLGQDSGVKNPPDFLLRLHRGQNYGFPACSWTVPKACASYAKPFKMFPPHTDVMGLAIFGGRLYMSEFGASKTEPPRVVSMPLGGGPTKTLLSGFVAPIVGLGIHGGYLYVGELTGQVFSVKL